MLIPLDMHWLFWDVDVEALDVDRDEVYILARVLERGRLSDIKWIMRQYGLERIHLFFKDIGHSEISRRTLAFWRAFFNAEGEKWQKTHSFRSSSSVPWVS
jgi:hypothetical protein